MPATDDAQAWGAVGGGPRPSSVLAAGSLLTLAAPPLLLWPAAGGAAWLVWGLALLSTGVGLVMSGLRPWLGPVGVVAGLFFLAQAACLVVALAGVNEAALAYRLLAVPKLLLLAVIGLVCSKHLNRRRRSLLVLAGLLGAAKILARAMDLVPAGWDDSLDLILNPLIGLALLAMARGLRKRENVWAHQSLELQSSSFEDFNRR